jgi:polyhydroxyalkanoate synthesis regulator phasin
VLEKEELNMIKKFVEDLSKQLTTGVDLIMLTQEQAGKSANVLLEQSKANLESTRKFMNEVVEQSKSNQKEMQNIFQQAFSNAFSN